MSSSPREKVLWMVSAMERGRRGNHLRALSVGCFQNRFLQDLLDASLPSTCRVYEIEQAVLRGPRTQIMCPRDSRMGCAYVDTIPDDCAEAGCAKFMLSYTWGYVVRDIVDTLSDFCRQRGFDLDATYVWVCCVCVNQHRVKERERAGEVVPFSVLQKAFATSVTDIGHMLAMMQPWDSPKYLTRIWCVFEMFTAISEEQCKVTVIMPPREKRAIIDRLTTSEIGDALDDVFRVLVDADVTKAEASYPCDRVRILELVNKQHGADGVNARVSSFLKEWIVSSTASAVHDVVATNAVDENVAIGLCMNVGWLLRQVKQREQALALFLTAKSRMEAAGTLQSTVGAMLLCNIGIVKADQLDFTGALSTFDEAKQMRKTIGELDTDDGAALLKTSGHLKVLQGDLVGASEDLKMARAIRERRDTVRTSPGASLLKVIGDLEVSRGNIAGAIGTYLEAKAIRETNDALHTPAGVELVAALASAYETSGALELAHDLYSEACAMDARISTTETPCHKELVASVDRIRTKLAT